MNFSESNNTDDLKFINDRTCTMGNFCSNRYGIVQVLFYIVQKIKHIFNMCSSFYTKTLNHWY